jgi:hypothetical protein
LRENAEQLNPLEKWYRILSEALRHFLHGLFRDSSDGRSATGSDGRLN